MPSSQETPKRVDDALRTCDKASDGQNLPRERQRHQMNHLSPRPFRRFNATHACALMVFVAVGNAACSSSDQGTDEHAVGNGHATNGNGGGNRSAGAGGREVIGGGTASSTATTSLAAGGRIPSATTNRPTAGNTSLSSATAVGGTSPQVGGTSGGGASAVRTTAVGGNVSGGTAALGGMRSQAAAPGAGGTTGKGGTIGAGGTTTLGGTFVQSGATSRAGSAGRSGTGGTIVSSAAAGADSIDGDRCNVGIYDAAHPPRVLTLSGSLGTHDPSAIESNGTCYLFATGLDAKLSSNLTTWTAAAAPLTTPTWLSTNVPGVSNLWAPDVSYFGDGYHLYYAGSTFGSNRSCIGHATRPLLSNGSWQDQGATICSNVTTKDDWNAIDPNLVIDEVGKPWLDFGSFWSGIKLIELDATGARVGTTVTSIAARPKDGGAIEGPYIVRRCGYYYLFTSWDTCCKGADSTYNIRVVRSTNIQGPYSDQAGVAALQGGGSLVAKGNSTWAGPGGQSVMLAGTNAYLVYHAYAVSNGDPTLRVAELVWDQSGWPVPVGP